MRELQPYYLKTTRTRFSRLTLFMLMMLISMGMFAQSTISGTVEDASGDPLVGVTIQEVGTTNGALSGVDGSYSIDVNSSDAVLRFTFIGFETQEISLNGKSALNISMVGSDVQLDDVVITALGISRDKKSLGYSVTEVQGEVLTKARENNVVNGLAGRVAGVQVSSTAGGPAASTRVIIRGNASLAGNNQPLYVVDGIPIDNTNLGSAGMWGGKDLGDGISSINPDDIENISVLKGPSATALYGTRAQNGAVLITTKKGTARKGIGVEINSNFTIEEPILDYPEFQYVYGSGTEGRAPATQDEAIQTSRSSWGARMDGQSVIQWDGVNRPYVAHPDNLDNFYNDAQTFTNTLSLNGGNQDATFRLSASDLNNRGLVPESGLRRNTFTLRGTAKMGSKLTADVKANYVREKAENRPSLSDTPENPGLVLTELASSIDQATLQNYLNEDGTRREWTNSQFRTNPYWGVDRQNNEDTRDRIIAFATLKYDFTDWLALQVRAGTDYYTFRQTDADGFGTSYVPLGRITEREWRVRETNADFLLMFNEDFGDISVSANLGGNRLDQSTERLQLNGNDFNVPDLETVSNTARQSIEYAITEKQINSFYGSAQIGYKDYLFLDITGRNDWSSTLPDNNNSYFYPSASLSFSFTDAFGINSNILSFGKVRASYAEVGGDTEPYRLDLTYNLVGQPVFGNPQAQIAQGTIPLADLKPTFTTSYEVGFDLRFFQNRLGIDFAWYKMNTQDQILGTTISPTSGYDQVTINAGELENTGIELLITGTPVQTKDFRWDVSFNFAQNENEVLSLTEGLEFLRLGESRQRNTFVEARVGQPYGAIVGRAFRRDEQGRKVFDANGDPLASEDLVILGTGVPDWIGGLNNTFTFKGISLGALIDIRQGGELHSMTNLRAYATGRHENTLEGREAFYAGTGGVVGDGVTESGEANTVARDPEIYFSNMASRISEEFIYDASFIKMRQITLSYALPRQWLANTPIQGLTLSLVGRNLFFISRDVQNIDPESNYNNSNAQGLEYGTLATPRSYGVNLNVKF
ncbi:MAG: SusC/RagA family TonB-linked outer membrane protein [Bacteroidota bacterium]